MALNEIESRRRIMFAEIMGSRVVRSDTERQLHLALFWEGFKAGVTGFKSPKPGEEPDWQAGYDAGKKCGAEAIKFYEAYLEGKR